MHVTAPAMAALSRSWLPSPTEFGTPCVALSFTSHPIFSPLSIQTIILPSPRSKYFRFTASRAEQSLLSRHRKGTDQSNPSKAANGRLPLAQQNGPTARARAPEASRSAGGPAGADTNTLLVTALISACLQKQVEGLDALREALDAGVARIQKVLEPLPAGFPPGPAGDSAVGLAADPLQFLDETRAAFGGAVGLKLAGEPVVLVSDPVLAREVLVTQADVFVKAGTAFFPGSSLAGNGLLVSDGSLWRRQRRLSNPAFRKTAIETYAEAMVAVSERLVSSQWRSSSGSVGTTRDVYADFNELTMEIVATALFGGPANGSAGMDQVGPAITTAFAFFTRRATTMLIIPEWVPTPDNLQYNAAVERLDRIVYRLIEERRRQLAAQGPTPEASGRAAGGRGEAAGAPAQETAPGVGAGEAGGKDLLTRLLLARDEDGSGMDDVALRDEFMTLLVAGQETSAILLAWASALLASHPAVQQRLADEVGEVLGGRRPTHADVPNLRYTEAVIWETLRLMPPAYIVGRCACRPTQLGPWSLPAGTTVLVSPYLLHRDPHHWPRVEEFDPSRWLTDGDAIPHNDNDSYWPFGGGPRNCIGMGFAMMEVALVLAVMMQRCTLALPPGTSPPEPRAMITLRPAGRVDLLINARSRQEVDM